MKESFVVSFQSIFILLILRRKTVEVAWFPMRLSKHTVFEKSQNLSNKIRPKHCSDFLHKPKRHFFTVFLSITVMKCVWCWYLWGVKDVWVVFDDEVGWWKGSLCQRREEVNLSGEGGGLQLSRQKRQKLATIWPVCEPADEANHADHHILAIVQFKKIPVYFLESSNIFWVSRCILTRIRWRPR